MQADCKLSEEPQFGGSVATGSIEVVSHTYTEHWKAHTVH